RRSHRSLHGLQPCPADLPRAAVTAEDASRLCGLSRRKARELAVGQAGPLRRPAPALKSRGKSLTSTGRGDAKATPRTPRADPSGARRILAARPAGTGRSRGRFSPLVL